MIDLGNSLQELLFFSRKAGTFIIHLHHFLRTIFQVSNVTNI